MDKDKSSTVATSGGIGFAGLLTVAFIVLKLVGVINWSWIWILSPLWISAGIGIIVCIIVLIIGIILFKKG